MVSLHALSVVHFCMVKDQTRRNFFRTVPLAAAAVSLSLTDNSLFASTAAPGGAQAAETVSHQQFQSFSAETIENLAQSLQANPGNKQLSGSKGSPYTIVLTVESKKIAKEFEYHEHRDHILQILEGTTQYDVGGTPQNQHSTGPGEWLAPSSEGSTSITLHKGDMLVIPRGTPHKRSTGESVTLTLISVQST
jgi:mannose-6-phosphate isomerase-like protein (cupin superfamily)